MNSHMSEILSWALEPLADALIPNSSEVVSNEDLKSKVDKLNQKNSSWIPDAKLEGDLSDAKSMMEAAMEVSGLCDCDECLNSKEDHSQPEDAVHSGSSDGQGVIPADGVYKVSTGVGVSSPPRGGEGLVPSLSGRKYQNQVSHNYACPIPLSPINWVGGGK